MLLAQNNGLGWDPFVEMRRLQSEMNRLFEDANRPQGTGSYPPVNLWLGENSVVVTAELPGLSANDVDLTVTDNVLTIRGNARQVRDDSQAAWHRRERAHGDFARTIELPFRVDSDRVRAKFVNGLLEIELQRPEADRPHKIAISTN